MPFEPQMARLFSRAWVLGIASAVALAALAGCSELPEPRQVEDAAGLARVAELLKSPPLRPVPAEIAELRPPYPCGKSLYLSMQFASEAGAVYFAGRDRYAVLDIGTGETIATGAGNPYGRISANGRVLVIPVDGGIELRETETGDSLAMLAGATGDEFDWVGDAGLVHIAPPVHAFAKPRVVYLDLERGLETNLATVDRRDPKYLLDFGVLSIPGHEQHYFQFRERIYRLTLNQSEENGVARLGDSISTRDFNPLRANLILGNRLVALESEAVVSLDLTTFEVSRTEVPRMFLDGLVRTADPERLLVRIYFKDDTGQPVRKQERVVGRNFYYSVQSNRLAAAPVET